MKTVVVIFLSFSFCLGLFLLMAWAVNEYGDDQFRRGWMAGSDYQRQRCYDAHAWRLGEEMTSEEKKEVAWAEYLKKRGER